ncbi:HAMP domain-containing histidine kinase [Candidatus Saccharibacteria bacterium]|nr:HAMP domain-containing histidine kinase [Candidatus Saccharibacteria bacterium]
MFRKLRNRFVLLNLLTTSLILIASYSIVFAVTSVNVRQKPLPFSEPLPLDQSEAVADFSGSVETSNFSEFETRILETRIREDRQASIDRLLLTLLCTGVAVEVIVAAFSFYFASEAIKPVKTAYETQKIFIANASHEIKTPVAAIKANLEAADLSSENHWIKNIELEADKIERLNLDLLKLAKTDAITEAVTLEETELKPLVKSTVAGFESRLKAKHLSLKTSYRLETKTSAKLNPADFREILEILLDNAIKYSKQKISLTLSPKSLELKNDGVTIPPEKLPHIFDRFYQVDKSASGSGLGLAIADSLAKRNGWHLTAASDSSSTSFTLHF